MAAWLRALLRLLIEAIISETLNFLDRPDVIADTPDPVLETIDPVESDSVRNADLLNRFRGSCSREEMALVSVAKEHPETRGLARIVEQETRTTVDDDGVERLAQDTTKAQVVGDATVRKLEIPKDGVEAAKDAGKPEKRRRLGYIVVPEADAAQLVRNTDRLSKILNDPELAKLVKEKATDAAQGHLGKAAKYCGVPNFHLLDEHLSRSAQPTADGMKVLREAGFKTIINLRNWHSDLDEIGTTGLALEEIPISAFKPNLDEVTRFLQIVSQKDRGPILVHCLHGADRTGMMCAFYRICFQDWSKEDAIEEMVEGGYGHHRKMFANLPEFIWDLDIEALKARAGIPFVMKACP